MKRIVTIFLLMTLACYELSAWDLWRRFREWGSPEVKYGVEWGYTATFLDAARYDYVDPVDGYRVDESTVDAYLYSNAHVSANIGIYFGNHFCTAIYAGYEGIKQDKRIFPVTVRASYYFKDYRSDGAFCFLEGGTGIHPNDKFVSNIGRIGAGYRLSLSRKGSLDLLMSLKLTGDRPEIANIHTGYPVPEHYIRYSNALYGAATLGIALNF